MRKYSYSRVVSPLWHSCACVDYKMYGFCTVYACRVTLSLSVTSGLRSAAWRTSTRIRKRNALGSACGAKGRFTMPKTQQKATSDLLRDQSPRQLSIHNVHVLATSRPPRPWYLHDVAGRKSPSTKRKWVPARQLWVLEPENFPPSLRASQG